MWPFLEPNLKGEKEMANKRGHGEGTYAQRESGRWQAQASLDGRRMSKTFDTAKECRAWLRDIYDQIENGLSIQGAKESVSSYLTIWLEDIQDTIRPKTWHQYEGVVRNHIVPILGKYRLNELQPRKIQGFYTQLKKKGATVRTIRVVHSVLHRALVVAQQQGLIGRNPASVVQPPRAPHKEMQIFSETQARQFLIAAREERNEALYYLALTTGMRQGEMLGLRWSDLDWSNGELNVSRKVQRVTKRGFIFSEPKTRAGRRIIKLGRETLGKLSEHLRAQDMERKAVGWQEMELIFPSAKGTPIDQRNLLREFGALLEKAGLSKIRFHDLRHTAATLMLLNGTPLLIVSRRLGHSKPSVTLDIYGHYLPGMQDEVAGMMDELVTPIAAELQRKEKQDV
jgi:integrase